MRLARAVLVVAVAGWSATTLAADDGRQRFRGLRQQPMARAAEDPLSAAARLAEADPRFASLVPADRAAWRDELARRALELGRRLRVDPLDLSGPDLSWPEWNVRPTLGEIHRGWRGGWRPGDLIAAVFPPIPWKNLPVRDRSWQPLALPGRPWQGLVGAPRRPARAPSVAAPPADPAYGIPWHGLVRYSSRVPAPLDRSKSHAIPWQGLVHAPPRMRRTSDHPPEWGGGRVLFVGVLLALAVAAAYVATVGLAIVALRRFGWARAGKLVAWLARWLAKPLALALTQWVDQLQAPTGARQGPPRSMRIAAVPPPEPTLTAPSAGAAWDAHAAALYAQGFTREAVRELLRNVLAALADRDWIRYDPALTNWDYRLQVPAGGPRTRFMELCRLFDRAWYGEREVDGQAFARAGELARELLEGHR